MSEFLGNLAARALGLSAVARPRPSLFEPRRAAPDPLALEPEAVSSPQASRAEEAPQAPNRRERTRSAREAEVQHRQPKPSVEIEAGVPPVRALPAERPPVRTRARAAPPLDDEPVNAPVFAETRARRAESPPESADVAAGRAIGAEPPVRPTRAAPEPSLAVRPSFPAELRRNAPEPTVRVTIGRIDVRAVKAEEAPEPRKKPRPGPRMSLDDYLGQTRERAR
jgi:hypothetical protein